MERGLTFEFREYVEFLHRSFNSEQVELICEAKMEYDSGCLGYGDCFEDAMWYKMNRSGLFEDEGWCVSDSRCYVSEVGFDTSREVQLRRSMAMMKNSPLWIGNK